MLTFVLQPIEYTAKKYLITHLKRLINKSCISFKYFIPKVDQLDVNIKQ